MIVIVMSVFSFMLVQGHDQMVYANELQLATSLASIYLSEVVSCYRWDELSYRIDTPNGYVPLGNASIVTEESSRAGYDDFDDYNGFSASGSHTLKDGTSLGSMFNPYSVSIQVFFVVFGSENQSGNATHLKRVIVDVQWNNQYSTRLSTILTNY